MNPLALLQACEHCYVYPGIVAGPEGRDAASVVRIQGHVVLVFRGTLTEGAAGFLDWLNDLRAELVFRPAYPGLVHAGFAASLDNLLPLLPRFSGPLAVTGHSKGGALAVLMGLRLAQRGASVRVVTFGAPRVGNDQLARAADEALTIDRYENPHDIVPRLPPLDYAPCGLYLGPPSGWIAPRGVRDNHTLATGYRPWIEECYGPAGPAAAA